MVALAPGATSSLTSPVHLLAFCASVQGASLVLADPVALSFAIDDLHDPDVAAAQIYPAPSGAVVASVESLAGPFVLADGMTLLVSLDDAATQTLTLTAGAFTAIGGDITNAPAWQVAAVVNELLDYGKSFPSSSATKTTIASDVPGAAGSVEILGGTANAVLGFSTTKAQGSGGTTTPHAVDLVADKLGTGRYVAVWTVPSNAPTGRYRIRWYVTQAVGDAERSWSEDFEVLAQPSLGTSYALVADVRDEGVTVAQASDRRISEALHNATTLIERWTGRVFVARWKAIRVDAAKNDYLILDEAIAGIEGIRSPSDPAGEFIASTGYEVYGRHLSQGLLSPDDRDSPKIRVHARSGYGDSYPGGYSYGAGYGSGVYSSFDRGRFGGAQQVEIHGVFGYTDPDPGGSPFGRTPSLISRCAVLLALRDLPKAGGLNAAGAFDAKMAHAVTNQRTREQSITWSDSASLRGPTNWTGDPTIDGILFTYCKGISVSGV